MRLPCFKNGAGIVPAKYDTSLHSRSQINSTTYPDKLEEGAVTTHQAVEVNDADTSDAKSVERLSGWRLYGTAFV
nr:hypothetical protein CFP56_07785 [Quercus suber]